MKRTIENELIQWKNQPNRLPLIIRGARQVGKTYTVTQFGKAHFHNCVTINFEKQHELNAYFDDWHPHEIIRKLEITLNTTITPQETLLFLDEIQDCPNALMALRYFKEELPDLHIIAAGSLLEFSLEAPKFRMPVGRIQFLYMYPLSFEEWLLATGKDKKYDFIRTVQLSDSIDKSLHQNLLEEFNLYTLIGGMPAVINTFIETKSYQESLKQQANLIEAYQNDFNKYATKTQVNHLKTILKKTPSLVGTQIKYSRIDSDSPALAIKTSIGLLQKAGLITQIIHSHASGLPLGAETKDTIFKLLFLDIGLMQYQMGITKDLFNSDLSLIHKGSLAEQIVGQELLAIQPSYQAPNLYYWHRTEKNSQAEIDYLIQSGKHIIPIEVKSGKRGSLRALSLFLNEKKQPFGVRISTHPMSKEQDLISLPLYLTSQIYRLIEKMEG